MKRFPSADLIACASHHTPSWRQLPASYSSLQVNEVQNAGIKIRHKQFLPRASCLKTRSFVPYARENCCNSSLLKGYHSCCTSENFAQSEL